MHVINFYSKKLSEIESSEKEEMLQKGEPKRTNNQMKYIIIKIAEYIILSECVLE